MTVRRKRVKSTPEREAGRAWRLAAQVLVDRGWVKNSWGTPETGFCSLGAYYFAHTGRPAPTWDSFRLQPQVQLFANWLHQTGRMPGTVAHDTTPQNTVMVFNDYGPSNGEEAIAALCAFADEMDPQS